MQKKMSDTENKKSDKLLVIFVGVFVAILRYIIREFEHVDKVIGIVNIVAFDYVVGIIINEIYQNIECRIKKENIYSKANTNKKINMLRKRKNIVSIAIFGPLSFFFIYICDSVFNDIISIISLSFSIASDYIVDCFVDNYRNWLHFR